MTERRKSAWQGAVSPPHIPRVAVTTPIPTPERPFIPSVLSRVTVDGRDWAIVGYKIEGSVDGEQRVTLTFIADVTIDHSRE
jgi:hypothetical protein